MTLPRIVQLSEKLLDYVAYIYPAADSRELRAEIEKFKLEQAEKEREVLA